MACAFSSSMRTESSLADTHGNSETSAKASAKARPITSRRLDTPRRLVETRNQVKAATHNASHARFNKEFAYSIYFEYTHTAARSPQAADALLE